MLRTLLLCVLVVGAAVALAIGSYSALAGAGPVTSVASAVIGADEPGEGDVVEDADDVDGVVAQQDGEGEKAIAQVIADEFGASQEDVLVLHEQGVGFGALFKLYLLSAAGAGTMEELRAAAEEDEGFAFGKRFKEMADQVSALSAGEDGMAKNLGQLVSASHRPEHTGPPEGAGPDAADEAASAGLEKAREKFAAHESNRHGPPESVPAHGRN